MTRREYDELVTETMSRDDFRALTAAQHQAVAARHAARAELAHQHHDSKSYWTWRVMQRCHLAAALGRPVEMDVNPWQHN